MLLDLYIGAYFLVHRLAFHIVVIISFIGLTYVAHIEVNIDVSILQRSSGDFYGKKKSALRLIRAMAEMIRLLTGEFVWVYCGIVRFPPTQNSGFTTLPRSRRRFYEQNPPSGERGGECDDLGF